MAKKRAARPARRPASRCYAGFWVRLGAAIVDCIFVGALSVFTLGFGGLVGYLINIYLVGTYGYSIGKKIFGLRITKENGKYPIGIVDALIREVLGKFVSTVVLLLGYAWIIIDEKKQGFHDKIAKTYVVCA
jgi:uncharacterized RDD family membrane protein YckC